LDKHALKKSCEPVDKVGKFRIDKDPQYYLKKSDYAELALSPLQKTRINTALAAGADPSSYLSPTQISWLKEGVRLSKLPYTLPLREAWKTIEKVVMEK